MYIHLKVHTQAKAEKFVKLKEDHFEIWVKEKAERNLANKRIIEVVRENFPKAKMVRIISGAQSPSKLISVDFDENYFVIK